MLKKIYEIIKKIIFSIVLLYGYNLIAEPINVIIPINIFTIGIITIMGFPALFGLIVIHILIY